MLSNILHKYIFNEKGTSLLSIIEQQILSTQYIIANNLYAFSQLNILHRNFCLQVYPKFRMTDLFVVQARQEAFRLEDHSLMEPLMTKIVTPDDINSMFSFSYFVKGKTHKETS